MNEPLLTFGYGTARAELIVTYYRGRRPLTGDHGTNASDNRQVIETFVPEPE